MKLINFIFIFLCVCFCGNVYSQNENLDHLFDEGRVSDKEMSFKLGIDIYNGEIPFSFEFLPLPRLGIEMGVGLVSLKRQSVLYEEIQSSTGFGFNGSIGFNYYQPNLIEGLNFGSLIRWNRLDDETYWDIIMVNVGLRKNITKSVLVSMSVGMGFRAFESAVFPMQLKLGYEI